MILIRLSGRSLSQVRRVPLEALRLTLNERASTAQMVPADMTGIGVGSWFLDDTKPGKGIVWRVRSISQAYATDTPTIQLEHMINSLRDRILFGEVTPTTMGGSTSSVTARKAVEYILGKQSDWTLGSFAFTDSGGWTFDGDTLYDALEKVCASLEDCWWTYDMSSYPFRLNITKKSATVGSVLRAGRNLVTITKTIDKSSMYTRFWPIGYDDLHISGNYVSRNTGTYGIVDKTETDTSLTTQAALKKWAEERLSKHAEPVVTIDVEGLELADATGESLDRLTLGTMCMIPLPEYGTTIIEPIIQLVYNDKAFQPETVKITLANNRDDISLAHILSESAKSTARSGRGSARKSKEDHAWFEDTNDHVAMCATAIIGTDADGNPNWVRMSELVADGTGIHARVESIQNDQVILGTKIEMNEKAITLEANQRISDTETLTGKISVEAGRITQEVKERKQGDASLEGKIVVEAGKISQIVSAVGSDGKVTAASIVLAVNESGSSVRIDADKVYIGNSKSTTVINGKLDASAVTADYLSAKISSITNLNVQSLTADWLGFKVNGTTYAAQNVLYNARITGPTDNEYKLQFQRVTAAGTDTWTDAGTFSRATALSGSWSGNTSTGKYYHVSASPQGNTLNSPSVNQLYVSGTKTWASNNKSFTVTLKTADGNNTELYEKRLEFDTTTSYNAGVSYATVTDLYTSGTKTWASNNKSFTILIKAKNSSNVDIYQETMEFDTTTSYNAGVNYAKPVSWTAGTAGTLPQFTAKATSTGGGSATKTYYLVKNGSYIEVHEGSQTGTVVARKSTT